MRVRELNYLIEAKNNDVALWSIAIPLSAIVETNLNLPTTNPETDAQDNYGETEYIITAMYPWAQVDSIEKLLAALKIQADKVVDLTQTQYGPIIRTVTIKDTNRFIQTVLGENKQHIYTNARLLHLMDVIHEIKKIQEHALYSNEHTMKISRPDFTIVETDAVTIKVPSKFIYPNAGTPHNWDYDYLLHPNQNMDLKAYKVNKLVLEQLVENAPEASKEKISSFNIPENLALWEGYTPNRYEIARNKMRDISLLTKAVINVIREDELYMQTQSDYFGVYQDSRMARENKAAFTEIIYNSGFSKEVTFPSVFRKALNLHPTEYFKIDEGELARYVETLQSPEELIIKQDMESIIKYVQLKKGKVLPKATMQLYEKLEHQRESARETIFMANLSMVGNLQELFEYFNNVLCQATVSLFQYKYTLGKEQNNQVKLEFKYKPSIIRDIDEGLTESNGETEWIDWDEELPPLTTLDIPEDIDLGIEEENIYNIGYIGDN